MTKRTFFIIIPIMLTLLFTSCSKTDNTPNNTNNNTEPATPDTTEDEQRQDFGLLHISIGGTVEVASDKIIVKGESNILPGERIHSRGKTDTFASIDHQDTAEIEDDGSFQFEYPSASKPVEVTLSLATGSERGTRQYGEHLEAAAGNHVYLTEDEGIYEARYTFDIDPRRPMPYTIDLETPDWSNAPDDYGDTDICMDVNATTKHNYLYFEGRSNLLEGADIYGHITDPEDLPASAWSSSHARVNPDGSFLMEIHYWDIRPGMQMHFEFDPSDTSWDNLNEAYGETGEHLTGDLVQEHDNGDKFIKYSIDLAGPDIEAPDSVDITLEDDEIKLNVPDDVLFDFDESRLKSDAKTTLDEIIDNLADMPTDFDMQIHGHTDNQGETDYNRTLSEARAEAVADYMTSNSDIDTDTITIEGFGETEPIAANNNDDERQKNRRVEIIINPK